MAVDELEGARDLVDKIFGANDRTSRKSLRPLVVFAAPVNVNYFLFNNENCGSTPQAAPKTNDEDPSLSALAELGRTMRGADALLAALDLPKIGGDW